MSEEYGNLRKTCSEINLDPNRALRLATVLKLGGGCGACTCRNPHVLQINHPYGAGRVHRAGEEKKLLLRKQWQGVLLGDNPHKLNVLCANCNFLHEYERGRICQISVHVEQAIREDVVNQRLLSPDASSHRHRPYFTKRWKELQITPHAYLRAYAVLVYGGVCGKCSYGDIRALHFNHIGGVGVVLRELNGVVCRDQPDSGFLRKIAMVGWRP